QLHPRGVLDKAAYELIGQAYARVEAAEPWLKGAKPLSQIGVFQVPNVADPFWAAGGSDEGAVRMLTQLKHQFDVVSVGSNLNPYELLILPDYVRVNDELSRKFKGYLARGGKILATGTSGLSLDGKQVLLPQLGIK